MKKISLFGIIMIMGAPFLVTVPLHAQEKKEKDLNLKNTIHFNLTNPMIFGNKSIILGYERVLNKRRSFSVNIGTTDFPKLGLINSDSIELNSVNEDVGFHFSADYRFYLSKENKYNAPRGVYIGPYYSYNYFKNNTTWMVKPTNGTSFSEVENKMELNIHTIGFELGYQFVFWDRLTVDMVLIGPGIASYSLKASFGTNLTEADKQKILEKINEVLVEKFPGYSRTIDDTEFKTTGVKNTTSFGYRYLIQVGFRF